MKNKIWAACMALVLMNISILFYVYGSTTMGDEKVAAQNISRLISTYTEPESNPMYLTRAEDRCRFYAGVYCPASKALRAKSVSLFQTPIKIKTTTQSEVYYSDYLTARARLIKATSDYTTFLDENTTNTAYITKSIAFEEEAGVLIGSIVSNLYALQDQALQDADHTGNWAFTLGYICNFLLMVLIGFSRWKYKKLRR
jgi:hypothetical protein